MEELIKYRYAELGTEGKDRYLVYFYAWDPSQNRLRKKRIYINRMKSESNRNRYARKLIDTINYKLDHGWNPWINNSDTTQYILLFKAMELMLKYKTAYVRQRSKDSYNSRIKIFKQWLKETGRENVWTFEFNESMAQEMMDWLLIKRKIKGRTYNNYLIDYRIFFNSMIRHKYISFNPFHAVIKIPQESKTKQPFSDDDTNNYKNYLVQNDPDFLIISQYTYYCALRPNEIVQLRVSNIDLRNHTIIVPAGISKNRKERHIIIPDLFYESLARSLNGQPGHYYVCSNDFRPGRTKIAPTRIAERFRHIADVIGLSKDIFFYSLKDTCADRLIASGFNPKEIKDHFGHSNIAITDQYLQKRNAYLNNHLKEGYPEL